MDDSADATARRHDDGLLNSWKEIAAFLHGGVRTVQRWERNLGLPVHRPGVPRSGPVFAFRGELEQWLRAKTKLRPELADPATASGDSELRAAS